MSYEFDLITAVKLYFKEGALLVIAAGGLLYVSMTGQLICCLKNERGETLLGRRFKHMLYILISCVLCILLCFMYLLFESNFPLGTIKLKLALKLMLRQQMVLS